MPNLKATTALVTIACLVLSLALLLFPWLMDLVPSDGTWRDARLRAWAPAMPIFGLLALGWSTLGRLVRKRGALGVGMSPEGIYHWSRFACCFYAWEWISEIRPTAQGAPRVGLAVAEPSIRPDNGEENWVARIDRTRRNSTRLGVTGLAVNPGAAYIALVF
ncbi:hypothetical protein ABN034_03785 [Actinopolymorpha sp. B11F2]|uniref:hypothetical protein n=1 Tax=Actinopolymorpha sp. B11F2 TaxID=3160862 RepID=UPI0032E3FCD5